MLRLLTVLLLLAVAGLALVIAHTNLTYNPAETQLRPAAATLHKLSRARRVAIYTGQGVVKFVPSYAHPIKQTDKQQSFWYFFNVQVQYVPTPVPIFWWTYWNTSTFVSTAREWRKGLQSTLRDDARTWLYDVMEVMLEKLDGSENGSSCLLRGICEISQLPFEENHIFGELFNAMLIPTMDNVAEKYLNARDAGRAGADCTRTYSQCSARLWRWLTHVTKTST